MQQTETYNLNLIETSDPFSPAPLNENAEKTEAAVLAEAAARAAADTAEANTRAAAVAALSNRVTVLEGHKVRMATGSYHGDTSATRIIPLPFTPKAVIVSRSTAFSTWHCTSGMSFWVNGKETLKCVEGGFWISAASHSEINCSDNFSYIALG